jgi:hypothetical protein
MGLELLKTALDEGQAQAPFLAEEITPEQLSDETALKLVVQDAQMAERYVNSKALPNEWNNIDDLYRAWVPTETWPGTNVPRASLSMPLILEAIENMLSQVHMAFFSDAKPFAMDPAGKTKPEAARAFGKVLLWSLKMSGAREEFRKVLKSAFLYGQCVGKWGWQISTHQKATYKKDADGSVKKHVQDHEISRPTFEFVELRNILVDPSLRNHDIRNARYVIHQSFVTADDLEDLTASGYTNVPTRAQLADILASQGESTDDSMGGNKVDTQRAYQAEGQDKQFSANPLNQPLEILEYTTRDSVITVLQRKIVIRNEENEFGRINYVSCAFIDVLGAWFGFGVARLLGGEQQLQAGVANRWIDALDLAMNPMWHRKKGVGANSQNINAAPGKVVNDDGELTPIKPNVESAEALQAISTSEARANRRVGANFGQEMPTQAMRTAEGVNSFTAGVQVRLQYFIENFASLVFIPVLEAFVQLAKDNLQPEQINVILSDEDGKEYEADVMDLYNGSYALEVLSSTKLAARRALAAMANQLTQMFTAEPVQNALLAQGKKVNFSEFVQQLIDMTGWPAEGLIVDATPEDIQRAMQMNPAVIAAQAKGQQLDQEHNNDMELEEAKGTARAGVSVVKHILDASHQPEPQAVKPLATALEGGPIATQPPAGK